MDFLEVKKLYENQGHVVVTNVKDSFKEYMVLEVPELGVKRYFLPNHYELQFSEVEGLKNRVEKLAEKIIESLNGFAEDVDSYEYGLPPTFYYPEMGEMVEKLIIKFLNE